MRILTRSNDRWFRRITATGLVPLLLLPGCVARHMPDWSKVQDVGHETTTEVQLYEDSANRGQRKIKGRFLSATDDSVTLKLKDGRTESFQKKDVRKLLTRRPVVNRWPGWVALVTPIALVGATASARGRAIDGTPAFYSALFLPAIPFFPLSMDGCNLRSPAQAQRLVSAGDKFPGNRDRETGGFKMTGNSAWHSWSRPARRRWRRQGSTRGKGRFDDACDSIVKHMVT